MSAKVSIVIVNFNRAAMTIDCVTSIEMHTKRGAYEIVVVDNGSAPEEVAALAAASQRFKLLPLNRNMFFGEASNIGAEHASEELVLFLNNDVVVTEHWLEPLLAVLDTSCAAGAVGPKIVHPNGELMEAGCFIRTDGWGIQMGKAGMRLPPSWADATRIVDYCSGACLLMRRSEFLALGGFDPIFDPAYFEDVDLAIRLRAAGLFTYYCAESAVLHEESMTSGRIWSPDERRGYIAKNHDRLLERWSGYLRDRIEQGREPHALAPVTWQAESNSQGDGGVVLYSPATMNSESAHQILPIAAMLCEYCQVIFAGDEIVSRCRIYSFGRNLGVALGSFKVQRLSDVDLDRCKLIVTFGGVLPTALASIPHCSFERDRFPLKEVLDRLR